MYRILILAVAVLFTGCSNLEFPGVYRLPIDQGNIITQEMVDQLKPGMSRSQVQFIMGTPLVADTFNADRWDYIYTFRDGDGNRTQQRLTIFFQNNRLEYFSGDVLPSALSATAEPATSQSAPHSS